MWKSSFNLLALCLPSVAIAALFSYALWRYKRQPLQPYFDSEISSQDITSINNSTAETLDVTVSPQSVTTGDTTATADSGYTEQSTPILTSQEEVFNVPSLSPQVDSPQLPVSLSTHSPSTIFTSDNSLKQSVDAIPIRGGRVRATIHLPIDIVGRFIGRQGRNIKSLMAESGAQIHVQQKNLSKDADIVPCVVQGTQSQIATALDLIILRHPEIPFPPHFPSLPSLYPPGLTEKVNKDSPKECSSASWDHILQPSLKPAAVFLAIVTYIEKLNCVWLVPYSSTQLLEDLHQNMTRCYTCSEGHLKDSKEKIPSIVNKFVSVRVSEEYWLRGQVMKENEGGLNYEVQLMDYGSSVIVSLSAIRPLRLVSPIVVHTRPLRGR